MGKAITFGGINEGEIFCKWLHSRLIEKNKNVLGAELGPTGSGKSYRDLRKAELWYKYHFKEPFPVKNICFGVGTVMKILSSGRLRKGEILIVEEAGVNLGSLDFQNKVSKMFSYVLQSFRSLNIGIFFNLPYLSMLNSQARHLLHYSFESAGIDFDNKINKCKPFFHQVAQSTGKIYKKYPIVKIKGRIRQVKRFNFSMPSKYLIESYEQMKAEYLSQLTKNFSEEIDKIESKLVQKKIPKDYEIEAYQRYLKGETQRVIAESLGKTQQSVALYIKNVKKFMETNKKP